MQQVARHNLRVHSQSKCVQIQSILIKCESQKLHNVAEQPSKDLWKCKITKCGQSIFTKCWSQECLFVWHINCENAPTTFLSILQAESLQNGSELHRKQLRFWTHESWKFVQKFLCKPWRRRTSEMHLNFTANSFISGRTNRGIAPRTFCKTRRQRTCKMHLNSTANNFIFGRINWENAPRTFFIKLERRKFQNASELHSKPLHFWMHKLWNSAYNFFCKTHRQRTSKMHLNFTANSVTFERTNRRIEAQHFL